eukprot:428152-Rhodomonas_salina.3
MAVQAVATHPLCRPDPPGGLGRERGEREGRRVKGRGEGGRRERGRGGREGEERARDLGDERMTRDPGQHRMARDADLGSNNMEALGGRAGGSAAADGDAAGLPHGAHRGEDDRDAAGPCRR